MIQYSNRLKLCWYNLEREVMDSKEKFLVWKILIYQMLFSVWLDTSSRNILWEPESLSMLSEPGNGYFRALAQGPHTAEHCFFSSGEKLNSFFLLCCFAVFWLTYAQKGPVPAEKMDHEESLETSFLEEEWQQHRGRSEVWAAGKLLLVLLGSPWCCKTAWPVFNSGSRQQGMWCCLHQARQLGHFMRR